MMSEDEIKAILDHPPRGVPQSIAATVLLDAENYKDMPGTFYEGAVWACKNIIGRADRADDLVSAVERTR